MWISPQGELMSQPMMSDYADKPQEYFDGARADIIARLPDDPSATILEIGCGNGSTGAIAKGQGKCARYVGIDVDERAASAARDVLDVVVLGNVEALDLTQFGGPFSAVILSEVLEHLIDPWKLLGRVNEIMRPGALVFASSPNVANMRLVVQLLRNRFDYTQAGVMDRTHLRWFTSATFREMFEQAGFETLSAGPLSAPSPKWRVINAVTGNALAHLASNQIMYCGRKSGN
jgi:2-polyprenyl-3-methyl-5-hydroxy-6-metoxy-1,4-benzoquinol methylase